MATPLMVMKDNNGNILYGLPPSDHVDDETLAAETGVQHAVPAGATAVLFSATCDFRAKAGGAATLPSGAVTDGSASQLNPIFWFISNITTIGLISKDGGEVCMAFYF